MAYSSVTRETAVVHGDSPSLIPSSVTSCGYGTHTNNVAPIFRLSKNCLKMLVRLSKNGLKMRIRLSKNCLKMLVLNTKLPLNDWSNTGKSRLTKNGETDISAKQQPKSTGCHFPSAEQGRLYKPLSHSMKTKHRDREVRFTVNKSNDDYMHMHQKNSAKTTSVEHLQALQTARAQAHK